MNHDLGNLSFLYVPWQCLTHGYSTIHPSGVLPVLPRQSPLLCLGHTGRQAYSLAGWPSCSVPHSTTHMQTPLLSSEWKMAACLVSSSFFMKRQTFQSLQNLQTFFFSSVCGICMSSHICSVMCASVWRLKLTWNHFFNHSPLSLFQSLVIETESSS